MNSDAGQKRPGIPPLALRQFREGDFDELAALNAYGLAAAGIKAADDYYSDQDFQDLQNTYAEPAGGTLLVGEINDKIVAMGGIRRTSPSSCELLRMRVYPQYQGRGYGTLILESLETAARQFAYRRITLITGRDQHPAVDLYAHHGYRTFKEESLLGIPCVHMAKEL
ncbi:GNAT family N-acetyltransferase [Polymorphospora sp. NPDC050346]|uniref:GNAT family N-acetyltransferase n=1 Tax=Polymorphospora sp. NPDC050346 TaxID=3155780 RepID=UPI0033FF204C